MEELYHEKGGDGEFNCVDVELTLDDLDALEQSLDESALPETVGFFFGANLTITTQSKTVSLSVRSVAIKQGYTVVYNSWV